MSEEPHSHMGIRYAYAGLDGEKVKAMLGLNGVRVYGFDGDHLHKVAQTINAPTLDDINHPLEQVPEGAGMWAFRTVGSFVVTRRVGRDAAPSPEEPSELVSISAASDGSSRRVSGSCRTSGVTSWSVGPWSSWLPRPPAGPEP